MKVQVVMLRPNPADKKKAAFNPDRASTNEKGRLIGK
jgi:hypothetical protein